MQVYYLAFQEKCEARDRDSILAIRLRLAVTAVTNTGCRSNCVGITGLSAITVCVATKTAAINIKKLGTQALNARFMFKVVWSLTEAGSFTARLV